MKKRLLPAGGVVVSGLSTGAGFNDALPPNSIRRNYIGTNAKGEHPGRNLLYLPAGNASAGVSVNWMLPTEIENNVIAYNGFLGVPAIAGRANFAFGRLFATRHLVVQSNTVYCNGSLLHRDSCGRGLGIDWRADAYAGAGTGSDRAFDGPTLNDEGDADDGQAGLQNFPTLELATGGVLGKLNSKPNTRFKIELYASDPGSATCVEINTPIPGGFTPDPLCGGSKFLSIQGGVSVAQREVGTDASGNASFSIELPGTGVVAATATRLENGRPVATSELSQAVRITQ